MRYLGKKSVSQVVSKWLSILWYGSMAGAAFILIGVFVANRNLEGFGLTIRGGLKIRVSPEYITPGFDYKKYFGLLLLSVLFMIPLYMAAIYQLRGLFREFVRNRPFNKENARRIRIVGWCVMASWLVDNVLGAALSWTIARNVQVPGVELSTNLFPRLTGLFLGLIILVLSEVFAEAALIKEEQDLTI